MKFPGGVALDKYLQRLQKDIASATRDISGDDLHRCPVEGKWSPAEILEHLTLTYAGTVKNLGRSLAAGRPLGGKPSLQQRLIKMVVLDLGFLPTGRKSPEAAKPKGVREEQFMARIHEAIAEMGVVIAECEKKFGKNASVGDHPILGPFTAQQWRKFHWVHGRHHVKQIERMRNGSSSSSD